MTVKKSKSISLLIIFIPILILMGLGTYFSYVSLKKYENNNRFIEQLNEVSKLESLERTVLVEIDCLAMASAKKNDAKEICKKFRFATDNVLAHLQSTDVQKTSLKILFPLLHLNEVKEKVSVKKFDISKLTALIKNIRYDVDSKREINLNSLIFGDYYRKLIDPIENYIKNIHLESYTLNQQKALQLHKSIKQNKYYEDLENILVIHYLSNHLVMPDAILKQWDTYIGKLSMPDIETMDGLGVVKLALLKLFNNTDYLKSLENIENTRLDIISSYAMGNYETKLGEWIGNIDTIDKTTRKALKTLINSLLYNIQKEQQRNERNFWLSLVLVLVSLLFTVLLIRYYLRVKEEDAALEQVVTNIKGLSLESDRQDTFIPKMPQNLGNKKEVYQYLETILKVLHQKEMEADEANKAKSLFLANMSHELRTPLNGIIGFTQLLKGTPLNEDQDEFTSIIEISSNNLLSIIDDVLDISKISADKMELEEISFDITEKVESVVEMLSTSAEQKDIVLGIYVDPLLSTQRIGDPTKITQVLTNLIGNAIKFTQEYGTVSVYVEADENDISKIKFSVKDTGIGISEENKEKIFDAFSQADSGTNREFGGTGLGLSISSQMIELMGGKIDLESKPNKGSTFSFILTLQEDKSITNEVSIHFEPMEIGLALPVKNIERDIDIFLEKYCIYFGQKFTIYYYDDIFNAENKIILPDVMIFDHHYARYEGELEKISALSCKKVLITNGLLKNRIDLDRHRFNAITYAPIMLHKIENVLQEVTGVNKNNEDIIDKEIEHFTNLKALVAEDNPINQKLIKLTLEKFGLDVTLVDNGQEAVHMRKENHYDIIFMDIQMPVLNGMEATKEILEYEKEGNLNHIPIIALTANALVGDREKYIDAGLDNYISKPIELESIKALIYEYFPSNIVREVVEPIKTEEPSIDKTVVENIDIKEKEVFNKVMPEVDILFYYPSGLMQNIFLKKLEKISLSIDIVFDGDSFLDKLENTKYTYVIYDIEAFQTNICLIADFVRDTGAEPFVLINEASVSNSFGTDELLVNMNVNEISKKLNI